MRFDKNSVDEVILGLLHAEESKLRTQKWARRNLVVQRDDYLHFYRLGPGSGLLEYPQKNISLVRSFRNFRSSSYHETGLVREDSFIQDFVRRVIMMIRDTRNQIFRKDILSRKKIASNECNLIRSSNIKLPRFDSNHSDFYYDFDGYSFNSNLKKYCMYLLLLRPYFLHRSDLTICEIGAGYGGLIELLTGNIDCKIYFAIDLVETLATSMVYLSNSILADKYDLILLESPEEIEKVTRGSIVFIPVNIFQENKNELVKKMKNIDLFINTESLGEMPPENVNEYFEFFHEFSDCYFFSSNTFQKAPGCVPIGEFPYDSKWNQIFETLNVGTSTVHTLSKR